MSIKISKIGFFRAVAFVVGISLGVTFMPNVVLAKKDIKNLETVETTRNTRNTRNTKNTKETKNTESAENIVGNVDVSSENDKTSSGESDIASAMKDIRDIKATKNTKNIKNTTGLNSEIPKDILISDFSIENKTDKAIEINETNKINEINKTDKTNKANITAKIATYEEAKEVNEVNIENNNNSSSTNSVKTGADVEVGTNKATTYPTGVVSSDHFVAETTDNLNTNANKNTAKNSDVKLVSDIANKAADKKITEDLKNITFNGTENTAKIQKAKKEQEKQKTRKIQKTQKIKETKNTEIVPKTNSVHGTKEIFFADNEQLPVFLSNRDINRVLVQGDKIQSINGPTGLYTAKNDVSGSAYISLYGDTTFTIFISTVSGHNFSLLVNPRSVAGRTIILIPTTPSPFVTNFGETENYQKTLVTLIGSMINNEALEDYSYSEKSEKSERSETSKAEKFKKNDFYGIADIKPIAFFNGSHLIGIVSEVRNKSKKIDQFKTILFL